MPGSRETMPKPVFCAMPTQPDHTSAAAGTARTSSGQDRMVLAWSRTVPDRSAAADRIGDRRRTRTGDVRSAVGVPGGLCHADVSQRCHAGTPSGSASGWGSPVSAASAAATSVSVARTYVDVALPVSPPPSVWPA